MNTTPGDYGLGVEVVDALAVCPSCYCLVAPSDRERHTGWHRLDAAVDLGAGAHIENLISRVARLEGQAEQAPDFPTAADVMIKALEVYTPEGVAIWLQARNRLLVDRAPVDVMTNDQDGVARVYQLLESMCAGAAT